MKRAFYEWGAITSLSLAVICFAWWTASLITSRLDTEFFLPVGHWQSTQVLVDHGLMTINDHRGSKEEIEHLARYGVLNPPLTSKRRWAAPGFLYQSVGWTRLIWSLQFSLLIPAILFALAATIFGHGYWRVRRAALNALLSERRTGQRSPHTAGPATRCA